jgi:hypothetical protein
MEEPHSLTIDPIGQQGAPKAILIPIAEAGAVLLAEIGTGRRLSRTPPLSKRFNKQRSNG